MGDTMYGGGIKLPQAIIDAQQEVVVEQAYQPPADKVQPVSGKRLYETPILDRGKLRDHLNTLAQHDFEVLQILPLDRTTVQVVCYAIIPETPVEGE